MKATTRAKKELNATFKCMLIAFLMADTHKKWDKNVKLIIGSVGALLAPIGWSRIRQEMPRTYSFRPVEPG